MHSYWELQGGLMRPIDLLVVGAGLAGLSTALHYKQMRPQARVVVLEQGEHLANASTRNAGFACFGSAGELLADLEEMDEAELAARVQLRFEGLKLLRKTLGIEAIGWEPVGGWELFTDDDYYQQVLGGLKRLNRLLEPVTGVPDTYQQAQPNGRRAIVNRLEGALHSGKLMATLLARVQAAGVEVRFGQQVKALHAGSVELTHGGELIAGAVVAATGAWTQQLLPEEGIVPGRGYVFVTNELPKLDWEGTWHYDRGYVYFRPVGRRLLLGGGRNLDFAGEETLEAGVNPTIKNWLVRFASETLGLGTDWQIDYEWAGIMGFGRAPLPYVREVKPGLWAAVGLGGIGVATGLALGRQAAERIAGHS